MAGEPKPRTAGTMFRFRTRMDGKVCPICAPFNGKVMPLSARLRASIPKGSVYQDTPPIHPNCRCIEEKEQWKWKKRVKGEPRKLVKGRAKHKLTV